VIGIKAGHELNGFPPIMMGQSTAAIQYCIKKPPTAPKIPKTRVIQGKPVQVEIAISQNNST